MTFLFKFDCTCRQNHWVLRTDRSYNDAKLYCYTCNTEIDVVITGISYSV